jgi:hypothetical protein
MEKTDMSRYYCGSKTTVEEATQLNIFKLKEFGLLRGYGASTLTWTYRLSGRQNSIGIIVNTNELYAKVNYANTSRTTGEKTDYDYKIQLTTTLCHFGSVRYWFICPLVVNGAYCGRRTGTLYLASGGNYFGCRHCYNLSYESQNKSHYGRFGIMGGVLNIERQIEKLSSQMKRWMYGGRLTRKARKIHALQQRMEAYNRIWRTMGI